jgi:hypothetical protein
LVLLVELRTRRSEIESKDDDAEVPRKSSEGLGDMRHFPSQVVSYRRVEERSNALVRLFTCVQGDWWSGSGQRQFLLTVSLAHHSQATLPRHFPRDIFVGYRCCNRCFFSMLCSSSLDFGMSPLQACICQVGFLSDGISSRDILARGRCSAAAKESFKQSFFSSTRQR